MINSRSIDDLTPDTAEKCRAFIAACFRMGVDVLITSTYRDSESQSLLYSQGRSAPGRVVTNAKISYHSFKVAFDFVPVVAGKAVWNDHKVWNACGSIAEACGLEWGGRWKAVDKPHCQNTQGFSIDDFLRGKANVK